VNIHSVAAMQSSYCAGINGRLRRIVRRIWLVNHVDLLNRDFGLDSRSASGECDERNTRNLRESSSVRSHGSNENKMSDGWRESASLRVEGGLS
jgi:hypothetical protein